MVYCFQTKLSFSLLRKKNVFFKKIKTHFLTYMTTVICLQLVQNARDHSLKSLGRFQTINYKGHTICKMIIVLVNLTKRVNRYTVGVQRAVFSFPYR